jgi:hypothetical protein
MLFVLYCIENTDVKTIDEIDIGAFCVFSGGFMSSDGHIDWRSNSSAVSCKYQFKINTFSIAFVESLCLEMLPFPCQYDRMGYISHPPICSTDTVRNIPGLNPTADFPAYSRNERLVNGR